MDLRDHFAALQGGWRYLDAATTSLVPREVARAVGCALELGGAHRGVHALSAAASSAYEGAREEIAESLGGAPEELVFVRSGTEGLNLLARGIGATLDPGDEVILSEAEHHSHLLPWRRVCAARGLALRIARVDDGGELDVEHLMRLVGARTRVVGLTQASNVTGAITPLREVASLLPEDVKLVVDGAQGLPHLGLRIPECDAYVLSGHKVYGPPGVGVVWAKQALWERFSPWLWGGGMVTRVHEDRVELDEGVARFEAGSPNVPGAVGLAAGLRFLAAHRDAERTASLVRHAEARLGAAPGVRLLGSPRARVGVISFVVDGVHPHDLGALASERRVAIRVGHHCAEPLLRRLGAGSAARASFGVYSRPEDVDALVEVIGEVRSLLLRSAG